MSGLSTAELDKQASGTLALRAAIQIRRFELLNLLLDMQACARSPTPRGGDDQDRNHISDCQRSKTVNLLEFHFTLCKYVYGETRLSSELPANVSPKCFSLCVLGKPADDSATCLKEG